MACKDRLRRSGRRSGLLVSCSLAAALLCSMGAGPVLAQTTVFYDDFTTDRGWTMNPGGTDTAVTGQWERGDPEATSSSGTAVQLDGCAGGTPTCLATGLPAGAGVGANDVDGGVTTIQSPAIRLPAAGVLTLSFNFYFSHLNNSSATDFFRVRVLRADGASAVVFEELGSALMDAASWTPRSVELGAFAGQTVRIQIEAADDAPGSLVEAAVDDVKVTATAACTDPKTLGVRAVADEYTPSGVFVRQGTSISVSASGTWQHARGTFGPGGSTVTSGKCRAGQLVARVGIFGITQCLSSSSTFTADADGHLNLWQWASGSGSSGSLSVTIAGGDSCSTAPPALPAPVLADPAVFASKCNPPFTFHNEDPSGASVFTDEVADVAAWYRGIARTVCAHLYKTAAEARPADSVDLFLRNCPGVAAKWGDRDINVEICTPHLRNVKNGGRSVRNEVTGIMTHESTHGFQWDDKPESNPPGWLIEGIADAVRMKADLISPAHLRRGGSYTNGYKTAAFFLLWIERQFPEFLYKLNQSLRVGDGTAWSPETFRTLTGKSIDALWEEYQAFLNGRV